jgi:murein hydrolase activator
MRGRIGLSGLLLLALAVGPSDPGRAEDTKDRLDRIRAEIEAREAEARKFAAMADTALEQIEAIDRELVEIRRSRRRLAQREQAAGQELTSARGGLAVAEKDLEEARARLADRLVVLYKFGATGGMPALYSARDFQTVIRLGQSLSKIVEGDLRTFARVREAGDTRDKSEGEVKGLETEIVETQQEIDARESQERQKLADRRNAVEVARSRSDRERRAVSELQDAAARLEKTLGSSESAALTEAGPGLERGRVPQPVEGKIRERFGRKVDPQFGTRVQRSGIEIQAEPGTPVKAVGKGKVLFAGWLPGYGQVVIVDHGEASVSVSGYLEEVAVKADDFLEGGDVIGSVGETGSLNGPGLYFELRRDGTPVDPVAWFK